MANPRFDTWFWVGRPHPWEFVLTFRLPWRRLIYDINFDEMRVGHPRWSFRLRYGRSVDQYTRRRLLRAGPPEDFNRGIE